MEVVRAITWSAVLHTVRDKHYRISVGFPVRGRKGEEGQQAPPCMAHFNYCSGSAKCCLLV